MSEVAANEASNTKIFLDAPLLDSFRRPCIDNLNYIYIHVDIYTLLLMDVFYTVYVVRMMAVSHC